MHVCMYLKEGMYVCLSVCLYVCMYVCMYACMDALMHACMVYEYSFACMLIYFGSRRASATRSAACSPTLTFDPSGAAAAAAEAADVLHTARRTGRRSQFVCVTALDSARLVEGEKQTEAETDRDWFTAPMRQTETETETRD